MNYVQSVLMSNENIIVTACTHWFIYTMPSIWLIAGFLLFFFLPYPYAYVCVIPLIIGILHFLQAWFYTFSTELAVTNKRVIAKFGFIRRQTVELKHSKVESVHVDQSIIGRIFNFGSIRVTGSGGTTAPIPYIKNPLLFRSAALTSNEEE